jgi:hypothetical protein
MEMTYPKSKSYLTHIPVRSHLEADILSKESTWNILGRVRAAGASGIAAQDIVKELDLPATIVYSTLKELRRLEFISILPKDRNNRERKRRYVCERATWGKYRVDSAFMHAISYEGVTRVLGEKLKGSMLEVFSNLFDEFATKSKLRPFAPVSDESRICPICNRNHEASEFVFAILLATLDTFITESNEFRELLVEKGFARSPALGEIGLQKP